MSKVQFVIEDNIPIPKREVEFGPRGSQYPIEQMEEGQSFVVPIEGVEGTVVKDKEGHTKTLTADEDAKKRASQKQSYFSAMGRKLGIRITTRYYVGTDEYGSHLRVWHNGYRTAEDDAADAAQGDEPVELD